MNDSETSEKKQKSHQQERMENAYDEIEDDHEDDDDGLFDSAIEATQRDELLQSISAFFIDQIVLKQ